MRGDELVPDAGIVFDRRGKLPAPPEEVWPWLVQLGKQRAGWYLPRRVERLIPPRRRALRHLDPHWQGVGVGDEIPDYGGPGETLEIVTLDPPHALIYRSERKRAVFSWALLLAPDGAGGTDIHLRLRGTMSSTGLKRRAFVLLGDAFDAATVLGMLAGLRERLAEAG